MEAIVLNDQFWSYSEHTILSETLGPLARGSSNVKVLHLMCFVWVEGCMEQLSSLFPHLEELEIRYKRAEVSYKPKVRCALETRMLVLTAIG